jgi:nitrogen fixation/metabolism regulation signal transduction histidine kinase
MTNAKGRSHARHDAPEKPTYKRQQYWVDAPLQLQMVGFVLVLVSASLLLTAFSVFRGVQEASAQSSQIFHSLEWIKGALRAPLVLASAISLLASGLLTLFWSHRFAGPLRVVAAGIARVRHGNLAVPVRVRVTDAHQEFAGEFQEMQDALRKMIESDRAHVAAAASAIEAARRAVEEGRTADEADEDLARALAELRQACAQYHL